MSLPIVILASGYGAAASAFLPRVAYRLAVPFGVAPRSACAGCGRPFPAGLRGWVRVGSSCPGRAFHRASPVPTGPLAMVAAGGLAAALLALALGTVAVLPALLPAVPLGVLLAAVDLRCLRLPDPLVGALAAVVVPPLVLLALVGGEPGRLARAAAAAGLAGAAYLMVALLPRQGLGFGDVKLAALLAFPLGFLGWPAVAAGMIAPHLVNGPVAVFLLVTARARRGTALPLGPALLAGALLGVVAA
ncbi:leader peptidase (prepilin peptidase)/N-methyltransferase [Krasilnikovia cinnamomea]|uniref:Leader peptidase (Prepilin peptidase)/N-methyltransferase n=1 Tax=Krasilnikovia cinnamomea TaxID=349313 RepID=A0A4Q7ZJI8_9ACTN|nr:prepilin peptidase [Krasilnikovia cinnamomea]RZU51057.1 leader peptidase (prepilin peptidase)/N-methyltransferase [Krasilnikovia cinnamomea]